jgi:hypothetical protein
MVPIGVREGCGSETLLIPLHSGRGGPLRYPLCVGASFSFAEISYSCGMST